jgi:hypothetical protein
VNNVEVVKKMSVSDKMKFFEKAMEEQHQPSPKPGRPYESAQEYVCNRMYDLFFCHAIYVLWSLVKQTDRNEGWEEDRNVCSKIFPT